VKCVLSVENSSPSPSIGFPEGTAFSSTGPFSTSIAKIFHAPERNNQSVDAKLSLLILLEHLCVPKHDYLYLALINILSRCVVVFVVSCPLLLVSGIPFYTFPETLHVTGPSDGSPRRIAKRSPATCSGMNR